MSLVIDRLALARSADYTACPEIERFITEHADDRYLNVQAHLKELADIEAEEPLSEEYRVLPIKEEPRRRDRTAWLRACIP
jgi:hypothetical protein